MTGDFHWFSDEGMEATFMLDVDAVAVYRSEGGVLIRRAARWDESEDVWIVAPPEFVPALVRRLVEVSEIDPRDIWPEMSEQSNSVRQPEPAA